MAEGGEVQDLSLPSILHLPNIERDHLSHQQDLRTVEKVCNVFKEKTINYKRAKTLLDNLVSNNIISKEDVDEWVNSRQTADKKEYFSFISKKVSRKHEARTVLMEWLKEFDQKLHNKFLDEEKDYAFKKIKARKPGKHAHTPKGKIEDIFLRCGFTSVYDPQSVEMSLMEVLIECLQDTDVPKHNYDKKSLVIDLLGFLRKEYSSTKHDSETTGIRPGRQERDRVLWESSVKRSLDMEDIETVLETASKRFGLTIHIVCLSEQVEEVVLYPELIMPTRHIYLGQIRENTFMPITPIWKKEGYDPESSRSFHRDISTLRIYLEQKKSEIQELQAKLKEKDELCEKHEEEIKRLKENISDLLKDKKAKEREIGELHKKMDEEAKRNRKRDEIVQKLQENIAKLNENRTPSKKSTSAQWHVGRRQRFRKFENLPPVSM